MKVNEEVVDKIFKLVFETDIDSATYNEKLIAMAALIGRKMKDKVDFCSTVDTIRYEFQESIRLKYDELTRNEEE